MLCQTNQRKDNWADLKDVHQIATNSNVFFLFRTSKAMIESKYLQGSKQRQNTQKSRLYPKNMCSFPLHRAYTKDMVPAFNRQERDDKIWGERSKAEYGGLPHFIDLIISKREPHLIVSISKTPPLPHTTRRGCDHLNMRRRGGGRCKG